MRGETRRCGAVLGGAVAVAGSVTAAVALGAHCWNRETTRVVARMHATAMEDAHAGVVERYDPGQLADAPAPVRRYFAFAVAPGQHALRRARLEHTGELASEPDRWKPFSSVQQVTTGPPGFVWDARIPMAPLPFGVRVRDSYVRGVGSMRAALGALVPLGGQQGTPEIAASALWRFLAEAVWLPTALLPSEHLTWTAVDDDTVRATLTDHGATAVADFHFGPRGEVVRVSGMRYRAVGDAQVLTATAGWHREYSRIGGMMIPTEGEIAWLLPEGPHAYWRARLARITYEP